MKIKFILGGAEARCERRESNGGPGGLPPGKILMITPFRSLENAPFLENLPLSSRASRRPFPENLKTITAVSRVDTLFLNCPI